MRRKLKVRTFFQSAYTYRHANTHLELNKEPLKSKKNKRTPWLLNEDATLGLGFE